MLLIDGIKTNIEKFRESRNQISFISFSVQFGGGNKNFIQNKQEISFILYL